MDIAAEFYKQGANSQRGTPTRESVRSQRGPAGHGGYYAPSTARLFQPTVVLQNDHSIGMFGYWLLASDPYYTKARQVMANPPTTGRWVMLFFTCCWS